MKVIKRFCVENCAAEPNLIESTLSRSEPPAAAETGLIMNLVNTLPIESVVDAAAIKLFALFAKYLSWVQKLLSVALRSTFLLQSALNVKSFAVNESLEFRGPLV